MIISRIARSLSNWLGRSGDGAAGLTEATFRQLAESSADVILRIGPDLRANYVSPSCEAVMGWSAEEMIGTGPELIMFPEDIDLLGGAANSLVSGLEESSVGIFRFRHKDGRTRWGESSMRRMRGSKAGVPGDLIINMRDITERKMYEEKLASLALRDGLTGLANRRAFDEQLEQAWIETLRTGGEISLLLMDIDHFKGFNDQYGHQVGDDALRAVAAALTSAFDGETCTLARYGGEEIALILLGQGAVVAGERAERARRAIEALQIPHVANATCGGVVTISIGAATALARAGGTTRMPEGLLGAADLALYKAKNNGRNGVETSLLIAPDGVSNT